MTFLRKNKPALISIILYYTWWLFIAIYFLFYSGAGENELLSPYILSSIILVLLYSASMIIQIIRTPEPRKTDYMILLGLVKIPAVIAFIFLAINA